MIVRSRLRRCKKSSASSRGCRCRRSARRPCHSTLPGADTLGARTRSQPETVICQMEPRRGSSIGRRPVAGARAVEIRPHRRNRRHPPRRSEANLSGVPEGALPASARPALTARAASRSGSIGRAGIYLEFALRQGETDVAVFAKFQRAGWEIVVLERRRRRLRVAGRRGLPPNSESTAHPFAR